MNAANMAVAQQPFSTNYIKCKGTEKFPPNSPYPGNLKAAFDFVIGKAAKDGYAKAVKGEKQSEVVFAIGMCGIYAKPDVCTSCMKNLTSQILQTCPNFKDAVGWGKDCMVRYSLDEYFTENKDTWIWINASTPTKVAKVDDFDRTANNLVVKLSKEACAGNQARKYATGEATYDSPPKTVYMVTQCTANLVSLQCNECFATVINGMKSCCSGKTEAAMLSPNCIMRYSHTDFRK